MSDLDCVPPAGADFGVVKDPEQSLRVSGVASALALGRPGTLRQGRGFCHVQCSAPHCGGNLTAQTYGGLRLNQFGRARSNCFFPYLLINRLNGVRPDPHVRSGYAQDCLPFLGQRSLPGRGRQSKGRPHLIDGVVIALAVHGHVC